MLLVTETGCGVGTALVVAVTEFAPVVVEPRMPATVLVEVARSVFAEEVTLDVGTVVPVTLATELPGDEDARAEVTEFSVPETELTGFTTGNADTAAVSESTVAGTELTVAVTGFRTGDVTAVVIGPKTEGRAATVPVRESATGNDVTVLVKVLRVVGTLAVIELTTGRDVTVLVKVLRVVGTLAVTELTTGRDATLLVKVLRVVGTLAVTELTTGSELTVFVKLSSVAGTVAATLLTVEFRVELGVGRRAASTGADVVVGAADEMPVVVGCGSAIAGTGSAGRRGARSVCAVGDVVDEAGAIAVGVRAVIRAN
ncbi:MAG TPA: hypothetical protein VGW57_04605 [Chthoniobacterales bacterium]|nr:hypothetical protein [Chthoniobacterales bacterium]